MHFRAAKPSAQGRRYSGRAAVIEPSPQPHSEPGPPTPTALPRHEPVVVEDLAAVIRLPALLGKIRRVLAQVLVLDQAPADFPFQLLSKVPGDGIREYGLSWSDRDQLLRVFAGMTWGTEGHDPIWEVRVEVLPPADPASLRARALHQIAARRADSRFSEWDRFWHEEDNKSHILFGASAACTRFFEEEDPDQTATNYLAGALYALRASGALEAVLAAQRDA